MAGSPRFIWLSALAAAPALAQPAVPPATDAIVVTGERLTREEAERRAERFVRQVGVAAGSRAAARWEDPVCPRAVGLAPEHIALVEHRVRAAAKEVGAKVAPPGCRPNIAISFTRNAKGLVQRIAARSPGRLAEVGQDARRALLSGDAPIRWWYTTEVRNRGGAPMVDVLHPALRVDSPDGGGGGAPVPNQGGGSTVSVGSSLISTQAERHLQTATVIVDADRLSGATLDRVAVYAAVVALAELTIEQPPPVSILALFDLAGSDARPRDMTAWDISFLRALYRLPLDRQARHHRGRLVRALAATGVGR